MKAETANQPLNNNQKTRLAILARMAFAISKQRGAVDDDADFDQWRYATQGEAVGLPTLGLREAVQGQFRELRGRFFVILGNAEAAFEDFMQGGDEKELRRQRMHRLAGNVGALAEFWRGEKGIDEPEAARQAWAYTTAIARDKARGRPLAELTAQELTQLGFTILNRLNQKRGVGSAANRNKSQRAKAQKPAAPDTAEAFPRPFAVAQTSVQVPESAPDCPNLPEREEISHTP